MPANYTLGHHFETFIETQLSSGRYSSASEVVRDALRLMEDRERCRSDLHTALNQGLADGEAGRVRDADDVFDDLIAKYKAMAAPKS